jgi:2-oxoglutarate dehydrogenase E2 component (dihydrolipoamide succinyltransferase)
MAVLTIPTLMPTNVDIPALGESVREAVLIKWHKKDGDQVAKDEPLCELETDKANVDVPSPAAGIIRRAKEEGATVRIGETIARIEESAGGSSSPSKPVTAEIPKAAPIESSKEEDLSPAVRRLVDENRLDPSRIPSSGPGGRLTKEDVLKHLEQLGGTVPPMPVPSTKPAVKPQSESPVIAPPQKAPSTAMMFDAEGIHRAPISKMRASIARRLVEAQHTAAILTTFNEVDLTEIIALRAKYKETFEKAHGIGLGYMSFFARAVVLGLREFARVNASIDGDEVVYHKYVHLGIAVSTDKGLAVPVLRNVQNMSFARIETEIKRLATAARDGKLGLEELSGATFTITNGGIFGSLLSTPILTPPQSGILGMHAIQKRPVVINDKIEIRSMMYLALSYDHRLVDGKESVSFLVRVKQLLEDPARLMLEI